MSNVSCYFKYAMIVFINSEALGFNPMSMSDQHITMYQINNKGMRVNYTFVYAHNFDLLRRGLWEILRRIHLASLGHG